MNNDKKPYGVIYKITNLVNDKVYIGQTIQGINKRFEQHCDINRKSILTSSIKKYGKRKFKIEVLETIYSKSQADEREKYWINNLNTMIPVGYNVQDGGVRNREKYNKTNYEVIKKIRISNKNNNGTIGISKQKSRNNYSSSLRVGEKLYIVAGIKDFNTAREVYNSLALYYDKDNAILNDIKIDDLAPMDIYGCRKYIRYINTGMLYNGIGNCATNKNKYSVKNKKIIKYITIDTQINGAYIYDYYNRLMNFDERLINFPDILLNKDDIFEIVNINRPNYREVKIDEL